ncbi:MAG: ribosome biogenesis GTPase Der, partial [Alphaproteobacteria bacterium]
QVRGIPVVTVSALTGEGLDRLMHAVFDIFAIWNSRVPTARLNQWLAAMLDQHAPPLVSGRRLKLRYMTQIKSRPPSFAIWTSRPDDLPEAYLRYLIHGLRDAFGLDGVPIRIGLRQSKNPYAPSD